MIDLAQAIRQKKQDGVVPILAEVKRLIPKLAAERGAGRDERDAGTLARAYHEGGAAGISLVTERRHFGGQPEADLPAVLRAVELPILVKDFITTKESIDFYARLAGQAGEEAVSRICLLLTAHLVQDELPSLLRYVHQRGMLALVETRRVEDLYHLASETPQLVGINNKDIDELEKGADLIGVNGAVISEYHRLLGDCLIISQSAHHSPEDVRTSIGAGADAVLVGTAFMTSAEPARTVRGFVHALEEAL